MAAAEALFAWLRELTGTDLREGPVRVAEACEIRFGVQFLCYTPEEFERKREELGIVRTATAEGVDLLDRDL